MATTIQGPLRPDGYSVPYIVTSQRRRRFSIDILECLVREYYGRHESGNIGEQRSYLVSRGDDEDDTKRENDSESDGF